MPLSQYRQVKDRRLLEKYLTDTCLIEAESAALGAAGEPAHSWTTTVAANVKCRVISSGGRWRSAEALVGAQEALVESYRLMCPVGTALDVNQRVTVSGVVYQIVALATAYSESLYTEALMVRAR